MFDVFPGQYPVSFFTFRLPVLISSLRLRDRFFSILSFFPDDNVFSLKVRKVRYFMIICFFACHDRFSSDSGMIVTCQNISQLPAFNVHLLLQSLHS